MTIKIATKSIYWKLQNYLILIIWMKNLYNQMLVLNCHQQHHNDTIIRTQEDFFNKIFTSNFIVRVRKRLLKVCVWEGAGDQTELKYFDPNSYGRQRCVFLVLLMLNRRPCGPLCWVLAFFTASYLQHLRSPNSIGVPDGPLRLGVVFLTTPCL